jgi:hypothetical protein
METKIEDQFSACSVQLQSLPATAEVAVDVSPEIPFAVGSTTVLSVSIAKEEAQAVPVAGSVAPASISRPVWLQNMMEMTEEVYMSSVVPGVLLSWSGDLNAESVKW